jgi:hypothetical protein
MATTTNYGWTTPDDTALVKDGALAIRTLGSSIDTSMAELKGGTTGQILSKTSSTDMDFTWVSKYDSELTINAQTGTTYTFALTDGNDVLITASNASAQTYSIPTNATVAFPIGTQLNLIQIGAGQVTVSATTPGTTTVLSNGGTAAAPKCRVQYSAFTAIKVATDTWYVIGDIA